MREDVVALHLIVRERFRRRLQHRAHHAPAYADARFFVHDFRPIFGTERTVLVQLYVAEIIENEAIAALEERDSKRDALKRKVEQPRGAEKNQKEKRNREQL